MAIFILEAHYPSQTNLGKQRRFSLSSCMRLVARPVQKWVQDGLPVETNYQH